MGGAKTTSKKNSSDYWILKRYDVLNVRGTVKLISPVDEEGNILRFVSEVFNIIHETHIELMHKSRDIMMHEH